VATCNSRTNGGKGRIYRERWENLRAMSCEGEKRGDSGTTGNKYTGKEGDDRGGDGITEAKAERAMGYAGMWRGVVTRLLHTTF
jgi:hypothetical protein